MCDSSPGAQGSGDHRGLDDLCLGRSGASRIATVDFDAVRSLRRESHGDGDKFLKLGGNGSVRDRSLIECPKCLHHLRGERIHFLEFG